MKNPNLQSCLQIWVYIQQKPDNQALLGRDRFFLTYAHEQSQTLIRLCNSVLADVADLLTIVKNILTSPNLGVTLGATKIKPH